MQCSGLFFANYIYNEAEQREFLQGGTRVVPIPNMDVCVQQGLQQPKVRMRGLLKSAANGGTKRIRSCGEVGKSLASASAPKRPTLDIDAQVVQERLQTAPPICDALLAP